MIIGLVLSVCHHLHPCSAFMPRTYVFGVQSVVERKTPPHPTAYTDPFEFDSGAPKEPINTDHVCGPSPGPSAKTPLLATPPTHRLCTTCDASVTVSNWARHQRTHSVRLSTKLPFTCEVCGSSFTTSSQRKRHHSRKHTPDAATSHPCGQCSRAFTVKENLFDHIRDVHRPMASRTCPHCQHRFSRPVRLKEHLKHKCLQAQVLNFEAAVGSVKQA